MGTTLNLNYEQASEQAKIVLADAEEIDRILKNLVANVEENVNNKNVWTGNSAQRFKQAWDECAASFDTFVRHIKTVQEKIDFAAGETSKFDN